MRRRSICTILVVCQAIASWAANGFAVSVSYNSSDQSNWGYWRGSLVRFKITDNKVTSTDELHNKANGYAYYPAINLAGTKVAFYRWGTPSQVAVVDLASKQVTNLCALPANPGREMPLDWPAGDWIYYVLPQNPSETDPQMRENVEIWRVNAITKVNAKYVYINDGRNPMPGEPSGWGPVFPAYIRRLSISLDGTRAGIQGVYWGWNCNSVYCFPPGGGNVKSSGCSIGGSGGSCNIALSCSGGYCGGYMQTAHDVVEMGKLPGAAGPSAIRLQLSSIESWLGENVGQGGELIRWARNSDKWVLQQIGWQGHADAILQGSNQIIANWVDGQAIRTSQNASGTRQCNCTGDFWVDGGAGNAGKYEGADGVWRTPAMTGIADAGAPGRTNACAADGPRPAKISLANISAKGDPRDPLFSEVYSLRGIRIAGTRMSGAGVVVRRALKR